jgi:hypothetical protein
LDKPGDSREVSSAWVQLGEHAVKPLQPRQIAGKELLLPALDVDLEQRRPSWIR